MDIQRWKTKKLMAVALAACMSTMVVSCGDDDDDDDNSGGTVQQQQEGVYRAVLVPTNPTIDPDIAGTVTVSHQGDDFRVEMDVRNAPGGVHAQHIHSGTSCATIAANDTNADGILDAAEAEAVIGRMLIPLDSNLDSNSQNSFPVGTRYTYVESASFARLSGQNSAENSDLQNEARDVANDVVEEVAPQLADTILEGRVVEIHGVPANRVLPATVAGMSGKSRQASLPIACGVLVRVDEATPVPTATPTPSPTPAAQDTTATGTGTGTGTTGTGTTGTGTTGTGTGTTTTGTM